MKENFKRVCLSIYDKSVYKKAYLYIRQFKTLRFI